MATIETERLILRDFAMSDWDRLNAIVSDPDVAHYMHFIHWDEDHRRAWLAHMAQYATTPHPWHDDWAITLRSSGDLIGWLDIGASQEVAETGTRGCSYALDACCWGQGYMTEALRAAIAYAWTVPGVQRIVADCDVPNVASARVMQKSGMSYAGTFSEADGEDAWSERQHYAISAPATEAP